MSLEEFLCQDSRTVFFGAVLPLIWKVVQRLCCTCTGRIWLHSRTVRLSLWTSCLRLRRPALNSTSTALPRPDAVPEKRQLLSLIIIINWLFSHYQFELFNLLLRLCVTAD